MKNMETMREIAKRIMNAKVLHCPEATTMNLAAVLRWHLGVLFMTAQPVCDPVAHARLLAELSC